MRYRYLTFAILALIGCQRAGETTRGDQVPPPSAPSAPQPPQLGAPQPNSNAGQPQAQAPVSPTTTANVLPQLADLAERLVPSVVSIQVETTGGGGDRRMPFGVDPFEFFGGRGQIEEPPGHGLGSGFLIDQAEGLVLTNNHVIENASDIEVSFSLADGVEQTVKGKVVGNAPDYDVALVKIAEPVNVPAIALGDSDAVRIGDWVLAIGNPFGLEHSVSVGIISAKQRRDIAPSGRSGLYDFLQTDASINPGNSGGPLINMRGEVVGMNSAINAQGQGIGFAIPINMVKNMLPQLRDGGFTRSWVGVRIQPLTKELAESFGLKDDHGVLVAEVVDNGPAARAGLRQGDVILEFNGKKLTRSSDLPLYASMAGVGKSVPVVVSRSGKHENLTVKLEAFPEDVARIRNGGQGAESSAPPEQTVGLALSDLTPSIRKQLGVSVEDGAVVQRVEPGSAASKAGLQRGDVIVNVAGKQVRNAHDVIASLKAVMSGQPVRFQLERQGTTLFVAMIKP